MLLPWKPVFNANAQAYLRIYGVEPHHANHDGCIEEQKLKNKFPFFRKTWQFKRRLESD